MNRRRLVLVLAAALLAPQSVLAHEGDHDHPDSPRPPQRVSPPTAPASTGGMYRWTDDRGRVHYSQGLESVPEQFRGKAVPLGQASSPAAGSRKP